MLKPLRRRLTLLMTGLTALVLGGALCVTWQMACRQFRSSNQALFDTALATVEEKLGNDDSITDRWLGEREAAARCAIFIQDNGTPLHFPGALRAQTDRDTLGQKAQQAAVQAGLVVEWNSTKKQTVAFALAGDAGEYYKGTAVMLPRNKSGRNNRLLLLMVQEQTAIEHQTQRMALQYAALWLAGVALLTLISWWLTGKALAPTVQSLRQQNEFVAAASHELRSPLAVITASLAAAQEADPQSGEQARFVRMAESEANRMTRLTNDLLLLAGTDAGAWSVRLLPVAMDTFCIEVYEQFYLLARQRGHELTLCLPENPLPTVQADEERLKQLLAILLNNAMEYAPTGTPVVLRATVDKAGLHLCVEDHGPGLPDGEKQRIFDRFYRSDKSRSDKAHFGLGLSVAQEIAAMHRATLSVEDTPGGGATFALVLPVKK